MPDGHSYWVYVLASDKLGTLYVGVTNSLERRIAEHKAKEIPGFSRQHDVDRLVFFQGFGEITEAIHFEKQLKRWRRDWKIRLIERENPHWADLYLEMVALPPLHPDLAAALAASQATCVIPVWAQPKTGTQPYPTPRWRRIWRNADGLDVVLPPIGGACGALGPGLRLRRNRDDSVGVLGWGVTLPAADPQ